MTVPPPPAVVAIMFFCTSVKDLGAGCVAKLPWAPAAAFWACVWAGICRFVRSGEPAWLPPPEGSCDRRGGCGSSLAVAGIPETSALTLTASDNPLNEPGIVTLGVPPEVVIMLNSA